MRLSNGALVSGTPKAFITMPCTQDVGTNGTVSFKATISDGGAGGGGGLAAPLPRESPR